MRGTGGNACLGVPKGDVPHEYNVHGSPETAFPIPETLGLDKGCVLLFP